MNHLKRRNEELIRKIKAGLRHYRITACLTSAQPSDPRLDRVGHECAREGWWRTGKYRMEGIGDDLTVSWCRYKKAEEKISSHCTSLMVVMAAQTSSTGHFDIPSHSETMQGLAVNKDQRLIDMQKKKKTGPRGLISPDAFWRSGQTSSQC